MVLDVASLNTHYYKVLVKWSNPGKGVVLRCSGFLKGNVQVNLEEGRQIYSIEFYGNIPSLFLFLCFLYGLCCLILVVFAQSAGAVEYTDCTSAEG